jgi:repressor LexA
MTQLKELRKQYHLKQNDLAQKLGISQGTLSCWENGRYEPDTESLQKIAKIFNVSIDFLLGQDNKKSGIRIPVLGKVQAGIPVDAIQEILDYEEISQKMAAQGEFFALQIRGSSMEPRMYEGDVVIVRKQSDVDNGAVAVVLVNNNDATVKRVMKHENGITLISFNDSFEPIFYSNSDIANMPVTILGKVVELRCKF